jgi:hypothetical protein
VDALALVAELAQDPHERRTVTAPITLTPEEDLVRHWLAQIGIKAEKLPESPSTPSCDFRAADQNHLYWVEVKSRTGDEILRAEFAQQNIASRRRTTGYHPTVAGILDDAVKQLDASSANEPSFEITWMLFTDPGDAALHFDQLVATVFGIKDVWDLALGEGAAKRCYFFDESTFFKHKRLDAVVAIDRPSGRYTICVNCFSPRRASFGSTKLYRHFEAVAQDSPDAVLDPATHEKAGRAYIVDCLIPRRDEAAVLAYVKQKYGLIQPIRYVLDRSDTYVRIPRS